MVAHMETRTCAADNCDNPFEPKIREQIYCSNACASRVRMRRLRDRRRKGGGSGGGGNGGGAGPTLVETITPVDPRAIYAPDTSYRTPKQEPNRKPVQPVFDIAEPAPEPARAA